MLLYFCQEILRRQTELNENAAEDDNEEDTGTALSYVQSENPLLFFDSFKVFFRVF